MYVDMGLSPAPPNPGHLGASSHRTMQVITGVVIDGVRYAVLKLGKGIKKVAKIVGKHVAKAAKKAGKAIKKGAKAVGKHVVKTAKKAGKAIKSAFTSLLKRRRRRQGRRRRLFGEVDMQMKQAVSEDRDMWERKFLNQVGEENVQVDEAAVGAWYQRYLKASGKTSNEQDLNELRSVLTEMELAEQFGEGDSWACR